MCALIVWLCIYALVDWLRGWAKVFDEVYVCFDRLVAYLCPRVLVVHVCLDRLVVYLCFVAVVRVSLQIVWWQLLCALIF